MKSLFSQFLFASVVVLFGTHALASRVAIDGFEGRIDGPSDFDFSGMVINISWDCYKSALTPTGYKDCRGDKSGEVNVQVNSDGTFEVPKIRSKRALFGYWPVDVSLTLPDNKVLSIGAYSDNGYYMNPVPVKQVKTDLQDLTLIQLEGGTFPMRVIAAERKKRIPFMDVTDWYPQSYNHYIHAQLRMVYDSTPDTVRTRPWHSTYSYVWEFEVDGEQLVVQDGLWVVKGFERDMSVALYFQLEPAVGLASETTPYRHVKKTFRKNLSLSSSEVMSLPVDFFQEFKEVVVRLDEEDANCDSAIAGL